MTLKRFALLGTLLLMAVSLAAQTTYAPAGAEWPTFNGTVDSRRYSGLDQINAVNVRKLRPVWMFQTGLANNSSSFECTPIVVRNTMYVTAPDDTVTALNAATGELKWQFTPKLLIDPSKEKLCCGHVNRGVAYYHAAKPENDLVYIGTLDARLMALNANTGTPAPAFGDNGVVTIINYNDGYSETAAPIVWDHKIFIGVAGSEFKTRGFISAYDAESGKMLWRWHTTPAPDEPGGDSWPPGAFATGGVGVWMNSTIDEKYRQVLFATGNPNPDFDGSGRKGDNLYSCSVVSVDADTGKLKWYFQEVRHDLWDYDQSSAPILFTSKVSGQPVDAAGAAGKTGWFYMLDRRTGKSLVPLKEVKTGGSDDASPVQWVPDQEPFVKHTNMWAPPKVLLNSNIAPGLSGGAEWSPLSFSPKTNYIYVAAIEKEMFFCKDPFAGGAAALSAAVKNVAAGAPPSTQNPLTCIELAILANFTGLNLGGVAVVPPQTNVHGEFIAINADTGKNVDGWSYPTTPHPIGGTLATAGDLVFAGESNGWFDALDAKSGKLLWRFQCGAGVNAAPMTFALQNLGGKPRQYVAVAAGGLAGASLPNATPDDPNAFKYFRNGNTVIVFALPDD